MYGDRLKQAMEAAQAEIEAGLTEAETELEELDHRRAELVALIGEARSALGREQVETAPEPRRLTLHEALALVLGEHDNEWMTARELADEVNERRLYSKRDGTPVQANQVHARTKNYSTLFEKDGGRVRLRQT
jgi:hypothetical protein